MRDKIEKILSLQGCEGYDAIGEILALIAPELEKAEKWDKVEEIARYDDSDDCLGCPIERQLNCYGAGASVMCAELAWLVNVLNQPDEVKP